MNARAVIAAAALLGAVACDWSAARMVDQERCEQDEPTALFPDGDCNRLPPEGVVEWRGGGRAAAATGIAPAPTRADLERGRDRFEIFCAACHGVLGDGVSQVAENMAFRKPPSLHEPRLVAYDDRRLFDVVTAGYGLMPAYREQLSEADRWAVVAYLRVLVRSQDVALDDLPAPLRAEALPWLR